MIVFHNFALRFDKFRNLFSLKRKKKSGMVSSCLWHPKSKKKQWRCELRCADRNLVNLSA